MADRRKWTQVIWFGPIYLQARAALALDVHQPRRKPAAWRVRGYNDAAWTKKEWEYPDLPSALRKIASLAKRARLRVPL